MSKETRKHRTDCLVAHGLDVFGDRWSLLVIRDMLLYGKRTYGDFLDGREQIATNVLAARLKLLETEGVVTKARDPESGRSYIYSLTEKGLRLAPVVLEIMRWSADYMPLSDRREALLHRLDHDREGLLSEIADKARAGRPFWT